MKYEELPYRRNVGIMLFNPGDLVFMGRRKSNSGPEHVDDVYSWQMPQGGIDEEEEPYQAAVRELREETGITSISLLAEASEWMAYDLPPHVGLAAWKGRYRGQVQKWFAFRFNGNESEINILTPADGHKAEFDSWKWVPISQVTSMIVPFKRPVYERVVDVFRPLCQI